jgi:transposase InsO family protein
VPWKESCRVEERMKFVARVRSGERMTALCREFGISRKTGYKLAQRFEQYSAVGLLDQRRVPERIPHRTSVEVAEMLVQMRERHPTWGPKKLRARFLTEHPAVAAPAASTIGALLKKRGLVAPRRRRHYPLVDYSPLCHAQAPNDVWCVDFKGQFRLGNGNYCYPLTITDAYSRMLRTCEGLENTRGDGARRAFEDSFRRWGLPRAIRSDNGTPFASQGLAGLSRLSVWWLRLGIGLERIEPASPQQNGRHERMHRTLKAEATRPAGANMLQQQERFDHFQDLYNKVRPHEALGQRPPAELYQAAAKRFPNRLSEPQYPLHDLVLKVHPAGHLYLPGSGQKTGNIFLSESLAGEHVGLRELDDEQWLVSFLHLDLAVLDLRARKIRPLPPSKPEQKPQASMG